MNSRFRIARRRGLIAFGAGALVLAGAAYLTFGGCDLCLAQQTSSFNLAAAIAQNCTISLATIPAGGTVNLTLEGSGTAHIGVATVTQICNKKNGYTLAVSSQNCATGAAGAKLADPGNPPASGGDWFSYSVAFHNNTAGSAAADVSGLLASSCATAVGNDVTGKMPAPGQTSDLYVDYNYVASGAVQVGNYADQLTVTMAVK